MYKPINVMLFKYGNKYIINSKIKILSEEEKQIRAKKL